ncbi:MAG: ABC transporter substrate-binding protein [Clostridia bacterium]|nr:ABC transporter substrate-binding protein [Clostridia bacterium]
MNKTTIFKKFFVIFLSILTLLTPLTGCKDEGLKTIRLNEVTHSVFYAPLYIAIENGYFREEGIEIELTNGGGADASMTALLSKTADIALMGPETVIYVQNQGKKDAPIVFAQLTQKDGSFLVSRNAEPDFKWENLQGKEILAGRRGGVPAMTFEYVLNQLGMTDGVDFKLNYDVQFNLMTSAFIGGTADYCTVFEPTASEYQKQGKWHVVASVGEKSGEIPYTSFITLNSFLDKQPDTLKSFIKALKKAFEYLNTHSEKDVAESIVKQFPSTTIESIETSIKSYKNIDAWKTNMQATESSFNRLQDVMENAGELDKRISFNKLVNNTLTKEIFG